MNASQPPASPSTTGPQPTRRPRVAVVFGGRSSEHGISCVTASGVLAAIDRDRYDVVPIGITPEGRWVLAADDPQRWRIGATLPQVKDGDGPAVLPPRDTRATDLVPAEGSGAAVGPIDVVLPLLHGPWGEDGTLQGLLELADVRYVGSGVLASAASMDKHVMKLLLAASGLPVGPHVVVTDARWRRDRAGALAAVAALGWPVFVKPARAGSSIGISRVAGPEELETAVEAARAHDPKVVVEAAIRGREIECGVLEALDGGPALASPPAEIEVVQGHDFYDFEAKYLDEASVRATCPADLPEAVTRRVQELAVATFEAMGCEGLARVDFFLCDDGTVLVNELNTMPGFTPHSMYPRMWQAGGVGYPELVDHLLQLALRRPVGLR